MSEVYEKLLKCWNGVREKSDFVPGAAIILGSGLGDYADDLKIEASVNYADIEGFPVSTVKGHKGRFVFAHVEGVPVVIMQGRVHYYEGYPMSDVVLPTRLMGLLGAKKIILTNAAGGVNYNFKPGDFMLITDHITTAVPNPLIGENIDELGTRFPDMSEVYAPELQEKVRKAAEKLQIPLQEGVYMQFTGPSYETPAEIRMCRTWGGDAAGMSTAPFFFLFSSRSNARTSRSCRVQAAEAYSRAFPFSVLPQNGCCPFPERGMCRSAWE